MSNENSTPSGTGRAFSPELLKFLIWPLVVLALALIFRPQIVAFFNTDNASEIEAKFGKEGLSIKRVERIAESAARAGAAAATSKDVRVTDQTFQNIAQSFTPAGVTAGKTRPIDQGRILWVDDVPDNNVDLIKSFQSLGIKVFIATSTEQGLSMTSADKFDLIITDMSRPPDDEAGLKLIQQLRANKSQTPVIIYSASWSGRHVGEEKRWDVIRITNDPSVVYHTAIRVLQGA